MAYGQRTSAVLAAVTGLLCVLALLRGAQAQCGGFGASCRSFSIGGDGIFRAQCRNNAGQYVSASVATNPHISNEDGNLVDGSNYLASCRSTGYYSIGSTVRITAVCTRRSGATSNTYYEISRKVANYNGNLVWNNCRRRSLLESTGAAAGGGRKVLSA
ncbi:hypothetical protein KC19_10G021600 [Ceratodon purpureus]|uniref:Cyanovirin-N domain-containing protein n=1 Tax=Ceratodon purpureus TaxID=3225 RepID=A0A8T0GH54_CERPU|nr:hypothetical protein KC19_10G021600 [Ceratodon purpureus]